MKKKYVLPMVFFLGNIAGQSSLANTSVPPPQDDPNNSSPMATLVNTSPTDASQANQLPSKPQLIDASISKNSTITATKPATTETSSQTAAAADCTYSIPEGVQPDTLSADTIVQWANYAAVETFTYDFRNYDKQFKQLKQCYTTAGWESFLSAMKASNNLKVTQEEHLFVSAKVNGNTQLLSQSSGDNGQPTWTVRVPLVVAYQNQDREVTQDMYIDLTIKTNYGVPTHLGVNQIIASPKTNNTSSQTT